MTAPTRLSVFLLACLNFAQGYLCPCKHGLAFNECHPSKCHDIDECSSRDQSPCEQICTNTIGSYMCSCHHGYNMSTTDPTKCKDIDECADQKPCQQICTNTNGSYSCSCRPGYTVNSFDRSKCDAQCGVSDSATSTSSPLRRRRVVGGAVTESCHTYPWMVRLDVDGVDVCGGLIIDATHILTGAQCAFEKSSITAVVGEYDTTVVEGTEQKFIVNMQTGVSIHPAFDYVAKTHDIAVLTLDTPINLTRACARPICLDPAYRVVSGTRCQIAGWGITDENSFTLSTKLRSASITTYQGEDCYTKFPDAGPDYVTDPGRQLCAGETAGGVDVCSGDAGGPLFCLNTSTNTWAAAGVASYGEGCGRAGYPSVYTEINAFYDWILQQL